MLVDELKHSVIAALKGGDSRRVETLRFLLAAVQNAAIAKYGSAADTKLTDQDVLAVIKAQAKTHRESVEAFEKAGREELASKEKEELTILSSYLPKELSDEELRSLLKPLVATPGEANFGLLMASAMKLVAGRADGGRVSSILKSLLPLS